MALRAVVPRQQIGGEMKLNNRLGADGKARRVLQDIGNLVIERVAQAKVDGMIWKGCGVEKKVVATAMVVVVAVAQRKVVEKPQLENVIVISSDETDKTMPVSKRRKEVKKSITSIFTT